MQHSVTTHLNMHTHQRCGNSSVFVPTTPLLSVASMIQSLDFTPAIPTPPSLPSSDMFITLLIMNALFTMPALIIMLGTCDHHLQVLKFHPPT